MTQKVKPKKVEQKGLRIVPPPAKPSGSKLAQALSAFCDQLDQEIDKIKRL